MHRILKSLLLLAACMVSATMSAQVTTAVLSGQVSASDGITVVGANVVAVHAPTGTRYATSTNAQGTFRINNMRVGGPYVLTVSYVGYKSEEQDDITLQVGDPYVVNITMQEEAYSLDEAVATAMSRNSNMRFDRAGAITSLNQQQVEMVPTATRTLDDVITLTPQGSAACGAFAVGGGNFRQSSVTVDGAQFNNTFGLSQRSILPGGGNPISLDAVEQVSVSITPFDVRQSGFNGAAVNAVTRSGSNDFHATAYSYLTNSNLTGNRVGSYEPFELDKSHSYTYGASVSGPIVKNKLFFFVNGEYMDFTTAGPVAHAGGGENGVYSNTNRRPTLDQLNSLSNYLGSHYGMTTGPWENFDLKTPAYRLMARLDWNINSNNTLNVRFTRSQMKESSAASASRSIGSAQ